MWARCGKVDLARGRIQHLTLICTDTAVIRNLTLNPRHDPLLVYQFRVLFTKLHSAYVIATSYAAMTLAQIQDRCKI